MFWLRARALWDTAKLVKMTSSICWATFNQDCYLVFSMPGDRPSHWNYSLDDWARAPRLSVCVLTGPVCTWGHPGTHNHVANVENCKQRQSMEFAHFNGWERNSILICWLLFFIRWDGIDDEMNSFLHQYTDGILVMVWKKAKCQTFFILYA